MDELATVVKVAICVLFAVGEAEACIRNIVGAVVEVAGMDLAAVSMAEVVVELPVSVLGVPVIVARVKLVVIADVQSGPLSHFCSEEIQVHCLGTRMGLIV